MCVMCTHYPHLSKAFLSQLLVKFVKCQFSCHYTGLQVHLTNRAGRCIGVPLGVKTFLFHH